MKTAFKNLSLFCALCLGILVASCEKGSEPEEQLAAVPFKRISLTCDGETTEGKLVDDKKINFTFNQAEDFTSATISVELNKGYTMTFPERLENVNLADTPVFNFKDNKNRVVKYYVTFSSNAFPIVDESKIQISALKPGEGFVLDNSKKTITIKYDQDRLVYEHITITFLEGALQNGVVVPDNLTYDFTNGLEQELILKLGGDRVYKVILDVSAYQKKQFSDFSFVEETGKYSLPEGSPIHVWATQSLQNIPLNVLGTTCYDESWTGNNYVYHLASHSNPRDWGVAPHGDEQNIQKIIETKGYPDWTFDDIFLFPGDWKEDRTLMNAYGKLVIILIDREKVNVGLSADAAGVTLGSCKSNMVAATGLNASSKEFIKYLVKSNGRMIQKYDGVPYRIGFSTKNGKLDIGVIGVKNDELYRIPYNTDTKVNRETTAAGMSEKLDADNAAWATAWGLHNGRLMGINEMVANDSKTYLSDDGYLGFGWNTNYYFNHILLGTTYDNKIALMISVPGSSQWEGAPKVDNLYVFPDGFYYHGYSMKQMIWLAGQLGWREAIDISHSEDGSAFTAGITVNGTGVITSGECPMPFDEYNNNGAALKASYILTIDARN